MNPILQPDVHPDAESLSAFVERALPQQERAQIVAHLGGCARCREVVFLAQAAAEADAAPLAAVMTKSHPAKSSWTSWGTNWRIALIPAAALATAVGLLVWVQFRSPSPAPAVAQVSRPSSPPALAAPPVPRPAQGVLAPSASAQHIESKAPRAERRDSPSKTLSMNGPAANEMTPERPAPVPEQKAPDRFGADQNSLSMARQEAIIAPSAPPVSPNAQSKAKAPERWRTAQQAQMTSSPAIAAQPPPVPAPPNLVAVHGNLMAPNTGGPRPLAAEAATSSQMELMPQPVNGLAALRLTSHPRLPSGLNAISSAAMLDRILAVDPDGAVFLSHDAAKHWERVPVQWTGKAVAVQAPPRESYPLNDAAQKIAALHTTPVASVSLMPSPPVQASVAPPSPDQSIKAAESAIAAPGPAPPPADAKAALEVPGMLFKLINDHHQTWVSADGKVWHEQQGRK